MWRSTRRPTTTGALPRAFARINPGYRSPDVSTLTTGGISAVLLVVLTVFNGNLVFDAFTALGLMIAFYYGITGFAYALYYRRQLLDSFRNALFIGVLPVAGGIMLTWVRRASRTRATRRAGCWPRPRRRGSAAPPDPRRRGAVRDRSGHDAPGRRAPGRLQAR